MTRIPRTMGRGLALVAFLRAASADPLAGASLRAPEAQPTRPPGLKVSAPLPRRGPIESHDQWLLAQGRLSLTATSPDLVPPGRTELRLEGDWGNDFGWSQRFVGERAVGRQYLIDGEHRMVSVGVRHGLGPRLDLGVRVPLHWRGPGIMDGLIDWFHGFTRPLGLPDGGRASFEVNRFRVEGRDRSGGAIAWTGRAGGGLGNVELEARFGLHPPRDAQAWKAALVGRAAIPTAGGAFDRAGLELGAQLVTARELRPSLDLYAGAGGTFFAEDELDGILYEKWRAHGFVALEWRFARVWSLLVQTDAASRLVSNMARYPGFQSYLKMGARVDLPRRWTLEGGFTENLASQDATTDFGIFLGMKRRF